MFLGLTIMQLADQVFHKLDAFFTVVNDFAHLIILTINRFLE